MNSVSIKIVSILLLPILLSIGMNFRNILTKNFFPLLPAAQKMQLRGNGHFCVLKSCQWYETGILLCSFDSNLFCASCYHASVTWDFETGSLCSQDTFLPTTFPLQQKKGEKTSSLAAGETLLCLKTLLIQLSKQSILHSTPWLKNKKIIIVHLSCAELKIF